MSDIFSYSAAAAVATDGWSPGLSTGQVVVRLLFVFLLLGAFAYIARRWRWPLARRAAGQGAAMEIVEVLPLGPQRALYVVRVGTRRLVIGATAQTIQLLTQWDEKKEVARPRPEDHAAGVQEFAKTLRTRMAQGTDDEDEKTAPGSGELAE